MTIEKFIGRRVEVIYQNGKGELSQRIVTVHSVRDGSARDFYCDKQAFRPLAELLGEPPSVGVFLFCLLFANKFELAGS
ncbi:hypothetical protein [Cohnella sp. AR92]|uniref:hypothetical protein n=1 Tax=Cohnella sp. AR92 TaxID=648716 RepID=UPI000F8D010F|nr:hypothetical protein [Cohnella sp. AR92]RUS48385.1 hypothetical protein ELR57_02900 [Cohnella sp. AR92]